MNIRIQSSVLGALGLVFCLAQPALAQAGSTPVGTLNATIDGKPYAGETLEMPSEGASTAEFRSFGPVTAITIQAHDPKARSRMHNVFSIEVTLMGNNASAAIMETSISWWPEGMSKAFYHSEGNEAALDVAFDSLSMEDGAAAIAGRFSGKVCRKESFFTEADMNACLPVEGTFDTALRKAD